MAKTSRDAATVLSTGANIAGLLSFQPIMLLMSSLFGIMSQHVPVISAFGLLGFSTFSLIAYVLFNIVAYYQSQRRKPKTSGKTSGSDSNLLEKCLSWKWTKWLVSLVMLGAAVYFFETSPPIPAGYSPDSLIYPIASYREMNKSTISGKTVILNAVPRDDPKHLMRISNKRFERCDILGPCVVGPDNCAFLQDAFGVFEEMDSILLETKSNGTVGTIGLYHCQFIQCNFRNISFAGKASDLEQLRKSAAGAPVLPNLP